MITEYLHAALRNAHYEHMPEEPAFYGEIPGFDGVWASGATLEACRDELREVLEEWILFRVSRKLPLPEVDGMCLRIDKVA